MQELRRQEFTDGMKVITHRGEIATLHKRIPSSQKYRQKWRFCEKDISPTYESNLLIPHQRVTFLHENLKTRNRYQFKKHFESVTDSHAWTPSMEDLDVIIDSYSKDSPIFLYARPFVGRISNNGYKDDIVLQWTSHREMIKAYNEFHIKLHNQLDRTNINPYKELKNAVIHSNNGSESMQYLLTKLSQIDWADDTDAIKSPVDRKDTDSDIPLTDGHVCQPSSKTFDYESGPQNNETAEMVQ
jgi:hypothetical protein